MSIDFDDMLNYVEKALFENDEERRQKSRHSFRSRFQHTKRVLGWCKRIECDLDCDKDVLYTSAIFHDIGYCKGQEGHAYQSNLMFREYAKEHSFSETFTETVANIIVRHSDKRLLNDKNSPNELIILLEADLLDEEGALGLTWDLMARGAKHSISYNEALDEIMNHSGHIIDQDYMVTPTAIKIWNEKKEFVRVFINNLKYDLFEE